LNVSFILTAHPWGNGRVFVIFWCKAPKNNKHPTFFPVVEQLPFFLIILTASCEEDVKNLRRLCDPFSHPKR
jgi:hypothetical protein